MPNTPGPIPLHVAIIMDGNGRWAQQRGLPRIEGHRRGVDTVSTIIDATKALGVRYLTLYAFSVENWKRPAAEVGALMGMLEFFLKRELATLVRDQIRLRTIGRTDQLPEAVRRQLDATIAATAHFTKYTLVLALNYGSRTEVVDAARAYAAALADGTIKAEDNSWESFARHLYTADLPDPDLVIRTSGEYRVSNFMLLQAAYAEFVFTPVLWPDFGPAELKAAVTAYGKRERRFGQTSEQLKPDASR
jgi:undecaprenyl diphosphate synthase